jgi:Cu2+-exporting ATPase
MIADFRRRFWVSLALTVPVLALDPMIQGILGLSATLTFPGDGLLLLALSSVVYFYGGWPFLKGMRDELQARNPAMMTLVAVAITAAYVYSAAVSLGLEGMPFFWELVTLIDIMLLGHWLEMRSIMGASGALEALVRLLPTTAHRLGADGEIEDVPVTGLGVGDRVVVRPGEKVPTDGLIVDGRSSLNESMLTGESKPVSRQAGDEAIGGSINGEGALTLEIRKTGDETYLAQVIEMVRQAQESRSRTQDIATRAARILTLVALAGGGTTLLIWLGLGYGLAFSLERMVTVMVIACPHALGLAVPLVVAVSTSMGATRGLLIRDRAAFERARELNAIVFDKTGTLTRGEFGVLQIVALGDLPEDEILRLAASLESVSEHPIALGVVRSAKERGLALGRVKDFQNLTGRGAEAKVDGQRLRVVSPGYVAEQDLAYDSAQVTPLMEGGNTVVFVAREDTVIGAIALADIIRPESREAVRRLKEMGIQCMMLTGDAEPVARSVAAELGLDDFFAQVLPHEKAEKIREVQSRGAAGRPDPSACGPSPAPPCAHARSPALPLRSASDPAVPSAR